MHTKNRTSTKAQRANRDAIVYPLRGIRALLLAYQRGQRDLNLAPVYRNLEWCFDTYAFLYDYLGIFQEEVTRLIVDVQDEVDSFNFSTVKNTEDNYTLALRAYED